MVTDTPIPPISNRRQQFVYIDRSVVNVKDSALTFTNTTGTVELPCAQIATLLLGPGVSITSAAVQLCGEMGVNIIWTGEQGIRYYAHGSPVARSSRIGIRQAELASDPKMRLKVARKMYEMRFPDENIGGYSLEQLRGREGVRVKRAYQAEAAKYSVDWDYRRSQMKEIPDDDYVNAGITMATSGLYGITHSVINAIGALPSIGFIHTGLSLSFVYDLADLYKTHIAVPLAFKVADNPDHHGNLDYHIRKQLRETFHRERLLERIVTDVKTLLDITEDMEELNIADLLYLWDGETKVSGNVNWGDK